MVVQGKCSITDNPASIIMVTLERGGEVVEVPDHRIFSNTGIIVELERDAE